MAKTFSTDTIVIAIAVLWSLFLPTYPDTLFTLIDGIVGVFFLLLVVILSLSYGPVAGILFFIAIALTFVERNRRKIQTKIIGPSAVTYEQQLAPSPPMSPEEIHPPFDHPAEEETQFYPEQDSSDGFEPVGSSIDMKHPNATATPHNDMTERLYVDQHLGDTELREIARVF